MEMMLLASILLLVVVVVILLFRNAGKTSINQASLETPFKQLESVLREELRLNREELSRQN